MSVDITVNETVNDVEIVVQPNVIEVNVTRTSGGGGGAVDSVNGQTGTVVLDADDIGSASTTNKFVTASEKTAITHSNRTILDAITESFTTALKSAYDSAVTWISTNGANLLNHLSNTSNPHSTTATQVDALKRDGSNASSDVDLGAFSLNTKAVKVNGTGGAGNVGLKHQSTNATASASETAIFAGSDGELYYKNDGNAVAQIASRAWVNAQGFITNIITALGFTPENSANKSTSTSDSASTTKFPVWSAILAYFDASRIRTILGISTLSGSNTGDQDLSGLMVKSNNLSDLTNASTARTNLGLGTLATQSGTFSGSSSGTNTGDETNGTILSKLGYTPANITNTPRLLKSIFTGNAVTGTETVVGTCQVGGIGLGSSFSLKCLLRSQKSNTTSQGNLKFYLNTTPDLIGSPVQIAVNASSSAIVIPLERTFTYSGGNLYGWNSTNNAPTDIANATVAETVTTVDMSTTRYIVATLQTTGTAGSTLNGRDFKVIVEPNVA